MLGHFRMILNYEKIKKAASRKPQAASRKLQAASLTAGPSDDRMN